MSSTKVAFLLLSAYCKLCVCVRQCKRERDREREYLARALPQGFCLVKLLWLNSAHQN